MPEKFLFSNSTMAALGRSPGVPSSSSFMPEMDADEHLVSEPLGSPDIQEMKQARGSNISPPHDPLAKTMKQSSPDYRHGSEVLKGLEGLSGTLPHPTSMSTKQLQEREMIRAQIRKTIYGSPEASEAILFDSSNVIKHDS